MNPPNDPMPSYRMIVGLEVHVQLKTESKLFCRCSTKFGGSPNTQVCPVCLGLPGSLPVLNKEAVRLAVKTGLALQSKIPSFTKWDRKNYFYPDLPKGYQISQFDLPICVGGSLEIDSTDSEAGTKRIRLIRAHLEEDAGKSMHDEVAGKADTRVDLNRTGTPLLEIVSEPDIRSAEEARAYLEELKLLLTYLDVSDCNMQEGSLRVDANVNLHIEKEGKTIATPITEIKNLNSFRAVERSLAYESDRQWKQWQVDGKTLAHGTKQTHGWNDEAGVTILQREKEESADYRYFPDPDLVPVAIHPEQIESTTRTLGELPRAKRQRFQLSYDLKPYDAEVIVSQGRAIADYFESLVQHGSTPKRASSWMQQDVLRTLKEQSISIEAFPLEAKQLGKLLQFIESGKLDTTRGKEVFQYLLSHPKESIDSAIAALGIVQVDSSELEAICRDLLAANPDVVSKVKEGNLKAIGSLVGQARKKNANADPKLVQEICMRIISSQQ